MFGAEIGYLLSGTYSYSEEPRYEQKRALASQEAPQKVRRSGIDAFEGQSSNISALLGGLFNKSERVVRPGSSRIALSTAYSRTSDNEGPDGAGGEFENEAIHRVKIDQAFNTSSVRSSRPKLAGEHQLGANHRIDWSGTLSGRAGKA